VRRQSVELTGATVGAVAIDELTSVNRPVRLDHSGSSSTAIMAQSGLSTKVAMHGNIRPCTGLQIRSTIALAQKMPKATIRPAY
jgi:hypothetical protein